MTQHSARRRDADRRRAGALSVEQARARARALLAERREQLRRDAEARRGGDDEGPDRA